MRCAMRMAWTYIPVALSYCRTLRVLLAMGVVGLHHARDASLRFCTRKFAVAFEHQGNGIIA